MSFHVTRQSYWHEAGRYAVELCWPTFEYSNPGMLVSHYPREDEGAEGFEDPREAAECAIDVLKAWRADTPNPYKNIPGITLVGPMGQYVYPSLEDACTIPQIRAWAKEVYAELPKCDFCGGLKGDADWHLVDDWDGGSFCSEQCAENEELRQHKELDNEDCPHRDDCIYHSPPDPTTCGACGLTWDDAIVTSWTPAPSARCPFEYFHEYVPGTDIPIQIGPEAIPDDFPVRPIDPEENE